LARMAAEEARSRELRLLAGAAEAVEQSSSYFPWRRGVATALGLDQSVDPLTRPQLVLRQLNQRPGLASLAPLLNLLLPELALPDNPATAAMTEEARAEQTRRLLLDILHHPSAPPPTPASPPPPAHPRHDRGGPRRPDPPTAARYPARPCRTGPHTDPARRWPVVRLCLVGASITRRAHRRAPGTTHHSAALPWGSTGPG